MNQRGFVMVFLLSLVFVSSFVVGANAFVEGTKEFFVGVGDIFYPTIGTLLGSELGSDALFFKVFLFLAYLAIVWSVLRRVPLFSDQAPLWVGWVVAFAVAVIGVRYLTPEALNAAALSSSATVLALFIFGSFAVFFYVIEFGVTNRLLRKLGWIILIAVYAGLWATTPTNKVTNVIYTVAVILSGLMLLVSGLLEKWRIRMQKEEAMDYDDAERYDRLLKEQEMKKEAYFDLLKRGQKVQAEKVKKSLQAIEKSIAALIK